MLKMIIKIENFLNKSYDQLCLDIVVGKFITLFIYCYHNPVFTQLIYGFSHMHITVLNDIKRELQWNGEQLKNNSVPCTYTRIHIELQYTQAM